ncbi:MAG: GNAT family protein [Endozoicomonas sp. (ex Botrylloides leachii)]|nr:GNAT family protein [Endozoicomonas sp. (ex Botrylloides leachii)]
MIKGKNINLRHIRREEIDLFYNYINEIKQSSLFLNTKIMTPFFLEKEYEQNGLISDDNEIFCITDKENNLIGMINHMKVVSYSSMREVGYSVFKPELRNKGIATEALSLITQYLFESTAIYRIQACMAVANTASEKVIKKCGFTFEGVMRGALFVRGEYLDAAVYSMLRNEYKGDY